MSNEPFEYLNNWNKKSFEVIKKLTKVNMGLSEKLMKEQMCMAKTIMEDSSKVVDTLSSCKDVNDIVAKQSKLAEDASKQIIESTRSCADIITEASQTYADLFEENIEAANKSAKTTPSTAAKKAV